MAKKERIDLSEDRLLDMASSFIDDHEYTAALKMLNKNAEINFADDRSFMMYAEIYDDLGLYEECINNWFKYLDCCEEPDFEEAYEGIAVAYMHLGNEQFAAHYYDKMLKETENLSAEARREIINCFLVKEENPLRFAYPPQKADFTADIEEGIQYIRESKPELAAECFGRVPEGNPKYLLARNYVAMSYVLGDMFDEAEEECNHILSIDSRNVQALTTLAAVRSEQKRGDEAVQIARHLIDLNVTEPEDIYKIATVCCENKLHAEAYDLFCSIDLDIVNTDRNMLFFKAVAAYNCGRYEQCFEAFDTLLAIYPDAVVARYYYSIAKQNYKDGDVKELSYFYRLPKDIREQSLTLLSALYSLSDKEAQKVTDELDALECIKWTFDETEASEDNDLHGFAAVCAVKAGYDNYVRDLLLNAFLPDVLKLNLMRLLAERNESNQFGVVICNIYKCVDFYHLDIGRAKRKRFVEAYAALLSRFAIMSDDYSLKIAATCEKVYKILEKDGALDMVKDSNTLAAAIISALNIKDPVFSRFDACEFFEANKKQYEKIMNVLQNS